MAIAPEKLNFLLEKVTKSRDKFETEQIGVQSATNDTIVKSESVLNTISNVEEILAEYKIESRDDETYVQSPDFILCQKNNDDRVVSCFDCQKNHFSKEDIERHITRGLCGGVSCDTCWNDFRSKEELLDHFQFSCLIFSVDGRNPVGRNFGFVCLECGKWHFTKLLLTKHEATHELKTCNHCNKTFRGQTNLRLHMKTHLLPEKLHKCNICFRVYSTSVTLARHKMKVHEIKDLDESRICKKSFSSQTQKTCHLVSKQGGKTPYWCDRCRKTFTTPSKLKVHVARHTEDRPFKCGTCSYSFKDIYKKKQHEKTHLGEKFTCETCFKTLAMSNKYNHMKSHSFGSDHCKLCGGEFKNMGALERHVKRAHSTWDYKCHDCFKMFPCLHDLRRHSVIHIDYKSYVCEVCDKAFFHLSAKMSHMVNHSEKKPFECEFCGAKYKRKNSIDSHRRSHTGEKPFPCKLCDKTFPTRASRASHIRGHSGSFKCEKCGENFDKEARLLWHLRVKHENNPKCTICGKKVKDVQQHIERNHRKRKPFTCQICRREFAHKGPAVRHLRTIHSLTDSGNITGGEYLEEKFFLCEICDMKFSEHWAWLKHKKSH